MKTSLLLLRLWITLFIHHRLEAQPLMEISDSDLNPEPLGISLLSNDLELSVLSNDPEPLGISLLSNDLELSVLSNDPEPLGISLLSNDLELSVLSNDPEPLGISLLSNDLELSVLSNDTEPLGISLLSNDLELSVLSNDPEPLGISLLSNDLELSVLSNDPEPLGISLLSNDLELSVLSNDPGPNQPGQSVDTVLESESMLFQTNLNEKEAFLQFPEKPRLSDSDMSVDELGLPLMTDCSLSISDASDTEMDFIPKLSSTPKSRRTYDPTRAQAKPTKPVPFQIASEMKIPTKRKQAAMDLSNIKTVLKQRCSCGKHCLEKMSFKAVHKQRYLYWSKPSYLQTQWLIYSLDLSEKFGRNSYMKLDYGEMVCSFAFTKILSIGKNLMTKIRKLHSKKALTHAGFRKRKETEQTVNAVTWIEEYISFHGDRLPNADIVLLPQKSIKMEIYKKYKEEREKTGTEYVKRSQFYSIMAKRFPHVKIRQTNPFSKCTTCITLEKEKEKELDPEKRALLNMKMNEHNNRQMEERRYYCAKKEESKLNPDKFMSIIIDGMDQAKTCLPHFAGRKAKCINQVDLLKTHITGVLNHGHGGFHSYVDFGQYQHDPNLTINVILKAIYKAKSRENSLPATLYIQADNCWRENKNKYVLGFLQLLVERKIFKEIHLSFLYVGHTHEDIDAQFSVISRKLKITDIETLDDFDKVLEKNELVNNMFDVRNWISPHLTDLIHITKPKHFKFVRTLENVKVYYKGKHNDEWIVIPSSVLSTIPSGKPKPLKPNFEIIKTDSKLKQIDTMKSFFKKGNAVVFWERFYKKLSDGSGNYFWILDDLPCQRKEGNTQLSIPSHIQQLMDKEEAIPVVQQKGASSNRKQKASKNNTAQSKQRKQKESACCSLQQELQYDQGL